jgi:lipoate-protein ligase A
MRGGVNHHPPAVLQRPPGRYYHSCMEREWRLIDSGACGAFHNMALDEAVAVYVRKEKAPPTLRLYGWERPSLTLGCFQKSADIDAAYCVSRGIPIVRRPTGGRAILHHRELTYSFSVRTDRGQFSKGLLDSYRSIAAAFHLAFQKAGVRAEPKKQRERGRVLAGSPLCFESSSFGEILVASKKAVGSAQKRWEDGLLQQGSVPYSYDAEEIRKVFGSGACAALGSAMTCLKEVAPGLSEEGFKEMLKASFEETFGVSFLPSCPSREEAVLARDLEASKYSLKSWNFQR